jgi:hypothetical protein
MAISRLPPVVDHDPRRLAWFVAAPSGPKHVVIVVDESKSMADHGRMEVAMEAADAAILSYPGGGDDDWGGGKGQDLDAPSPAFFGGGGDGDLLSSLLAGFADDPIMENMMEIVKTCGIDVADMANKALAAFIMTPGVAGADFSSPKAFEDPAALLGLVAPILLALKDDDEGDCGEDDSSLIQDAFEGYLQCSGGTRMFDLIRIIIHQYLTVASFPRRSIQSFLPSPRHSC